MGEAEGTSTPKYFKDSFTLYNGVVPCVTETRSSKCLNKDSHPREAPSPSVNLVRVGKSSNGDDVE